MALEIGDPPYEPDRHLISILVFTGYTKSVPGFGEMLECFTLFMSRDLFYRLYPDGIYKTGLENPPADSTYD